MTTLAEMMLETARVVGNVFESTATGGSTTTLVDTRLQAEADFYRDGTLWVLDGDNAGLCDVVTSFLENTLTIESTLTDAIVAGNSYAVADGKFPKRMLKQAILASLTKEKVMKINSSLSVTADTEDYALPTGVSDVRRVEVATTASGSYEINYFWREMDGRLYFMKGKEPKTAGRTIRLYYAALHGTIGDSDAINDAIDLNLLKWRGVVHLYRNYMQRMYKDEPQIIDLLNEAKVNEAQALARRVPPTFNRDPIHTGW
ncbi:MAG: hypothetical protein GYA59_12575 [Chloroflexi bacterium]|nr:hypothetical protein [Chloroflexota bacterium]